MAIRALELPVIDVGVAACVDFANVIAPPPSGQRPRARHIFPLRFRQQPVWLTRFPAKPRHVGFRVLPTHVDHGTATPTPAFVSGTKAAATAARHTGILLRERHLKLSHREWFIYRHAVQWPLVVGPTLFTHR